MRWFPFLLVAVLAAGCGHKGPATSPGAPRTEVSPPRAAARPWQADAKWLDHLSEPEEVAGYLVRPPKGYRRTATNVPPITQVSWESPPRAGHQRTYLAVSVVTLADAGNAKHQPERVIDDSLDALRRITQGMAASSAERGNLNGVPFVRRHYSGTDVARKCFTRGAQCAARDGDRLVQISAYEFTAAEGEDHLGEAEAALLTFRRK